MKRYVASPAALARFRTLCLVMLGALALMLVQVLQDLFISWITAPAGKPWSVTYGVPLTELACVLFSAFVALRFVRKGRLPGIPAILALVALVWALVVVGHNS
ncbi:MAG TPA: hypothetical protein VFH27_01230 [Longimicrobiaceae bacterium]|nr:hypothetical protein [Longimicrobiaceae bacterium]